MGSIASNTKLLQRNQPMSTVKVVIIEYVRILIYNMMFMTVFHIFYFLISIFDK